MSVSDVSSNPSRIYTVFRVARAGVDPLSTLGSQANGGRYNAPGMGVLYTSMSKATAVAEVARGLRARGVNPSNFGRGDWWAYEIRVSANRVMDLGEEVDRSSLGVTSEMLVAEDTTETRRIGKYARDHGFDAIIAPSAAVSDNDNLVLFVDKLAIPPEVVSSTPVDLSSAG